MSLHEWLKLYPVFFKCFGRLPFRHLLYMAKVMRYENPHLHDGRVHINTFFPPYPSKAFDRFLDSVIECKRVPFSTYFAVTDKCPFKCPHCSYGNHVQGDLDTARAIEAIRQIRSIGTVTIGFTGGEPLLRDDMIELLESVGDDMATVIFSTGHRLTKELASDLKRADLDCMTIGIESDDAAEHDKTRGVDGSFDETVRAIGISLEAGIYTSISTVATREKMQDGTIERLAGFATKHGVHEFRILEPVPTGRLRDERAWMLTAEESGRLADFHKGWNRKGEGPAIAGFSHLESDEMFGCGAGFHHLFVDAIGNVCPCDLTPISLGNLFDEPLLEIWNRMSEWFDLPRCGCFMGQICEDMTGEDTLPVCREKATVLCDGNRRGEKLPAVFANLFKNRKPTNPPANRQ